MQQNLPPYDYRYNRPPDPQYQTVRRSSSNITLAEMQNLFLQNPNLLLRLEQDYVENVLYDLLFEVAIDVLWSIKSGNTTIEDLYQVKPLSVYYSLPIRTEEKKVRCNIARPPLPPIPVSSVQTEPSSSSSAPSSSSSSNHNVNNKNIVCPVCNELVAAVRFAYHLEKDMNGGKRGTRKHYDYLRDETYERPRPKKEHVDPNPNSMIVKIRLRNGVPYGNTKRIGVTLEDFLAHQSEAQRAMFTSQVNQSGNNNCDNGINTNGTGNRLELDGIETVSTNMNEEYEEEDGYTVDTNTIP